MTGFELALIWAMIGVATGFIIEFLEWYDGSDITTGEIVTVMIVCAIAGPISTVIAAVPVVTGLFRLISFLFSPLNFSIKGRKQ